MSIEERKSLGSGLVCGALAVLLCAAPLSAGTIHVPGDEPTIQAGIDAASDGDEVVVAEGVYSGPGNRDISFRGKRIWVRSETGPENCIVDCGGLGFGFEFSDGEGRDSVLDGITIRNGVTASEGAGVACIGASPTIVGCLVVGNDAPAGRGGGILCSDGSPLIEGCTIASNNAGSEGGGVGCTNSSAILVDCFITGNTAKFQGGGVSSRFPGELTMSGCTVTGNLAEISGGGGIACDSTGMIVVGCVVSDNTALMAGGGGGILVDFGSLATVVNCEITDNVASVGGGIALAGIGANIVNCTLTGNHAAGGGGGVYSFGGGNLSNCILWNDSPDEIGGANDIVVRFSDVQGSWPGTGNIDDPPLFVAPVIGNFRLRPGSPCIDAGENGALPPVITTDLDGQPRFVDDPDTPDTGSGTPPIVDMGAYEFRPPFPGADVPKERPGIDLGFLDVLEGLVNRHAAQTF